MMYKKYLILILIALSLILISSITLADDSYEPNDFFGDAKEITEGDHTNLDCVDGDDDYYYIYVDTGNTLTVKLFFDGEIGDIDISLYDSSQTELDYSGEYEDYEVVSYYVTSAGNYYIEVYNWDDTVTPYEMNIEIIPGEIYEDAFEPNNNHGSAASITTGLHADLYCSDNDWYYLNVNSGNTLIVDIFFTHTTGNLDLELYDSSKSRLTVSWSTDDNESAYWGVTITADYYIFVENLDPGSNDYEMNVSIISGVIPLSTITITNPKSSSVWDIGTSYEINWTSTGEFSNVFIQLYQSSPWEFVKGISLNTPNDGSFWWTPLAIPSGSYTIIIADLDTDPYDLSDSFTITIVETKSITVTSPIFSSIWNNGSSYEINWTSTGIISNVNINLFNTSGWIDNIASNTPNNGIYAWTIEDYPSGSDYYINISDSINALINDVSDDFAINNTNLPIELIIIENPRSSPTWYKNFKYEITWVTSGTFEYVDIELWNSTNLILTIAFNANNNGSFFWTIPSNLTSGNDYHIQIYDSDDNDPIAISDDFVIIDKPVGDDDGGGSDGGGGGKEAIPGYPIYTLLGFTFFVIISLILIYLRKRHIN